MLTDDEMFQEIKEIQEKVIQKAEKRIYKKSSTFWKNKLKIFKKHPITVEKVKSLLNRADLRAEVEGAEFGEEKDDDNIFFTPAILVPPLGDKFFQEIQSREYESENEVEAFFVRDLLENLGYKFEDIFMQYPIIDKKKKERPDFVVFQGPKREDVLLVVEAKINDITEDDEVQAASYAYELKPVYYILTNGKKINVYIPNPKMKTDSIIMDLDVSMLKERWKDVYRCIGKEATIERKLKRKTAIL